ncbi:ABC transporter substrate-binding protein [Microvirgula aerodenitrificans]|uniref:ABC transporter substrate-binding protein n=1 Tax=Microvirgula aerodenitrificans TaxID=57480 RepID=UPI000688C0DE|nr:ABC transporter substrate-binding protein [Microvirgula aerodenitrificans]
MNLRHGLIALLSGFAPLLAATPQRIVTIPIPAASMITALDAGPQRLVGIHPGALPGIRDRFLGQRFPALLTLRTDIVAGGRFTPNIETLLTLRPDLVLQWTHLPTASLHTLERAGLRTLGMRYGSQADLEAALTAIGAATGTEARTGALLRHQRNTRRALAGPSGPRPRVVYLRSLAHGLKAGGNGSYMTHVIELAGGVNLATAVNGSMADVTFEQLLGWAPDILLLGGFDDNVPARLYADPKWRAVKAVRERRVYKMPLGGIWWEVPSHESALGWIWLHALLNHSPASAARLLADMRSQYRLLYRHTLTRDEIDRILHRNANAGSAGYTLFGEAANVGQ